MTLYYKIKQNKDLSDIELFSGLKPAKKKYLCHNEKFFFFSDDIPHGILIKEVFSLDEFKKYIFVNNIEKGMSFSNRLRGLNDTT